MASSWVAIANAALIKLGAQTIISLDDNVKSARLCQARYEECRDIVLRKHIWNCALKRVQLAPLTETPAFDWTYLFELPADFIRVAKIGPLDPDYKVEGRKLLANTNQLDLKYIYRVTDPVQLDILCAEAIACYLAFDISFSLTQSESVRQDMAKLFVDALRSAKSADAKEEMAEEIIADEFVDARINPLHWSRVDNKLAI